MEEGKVLVSRGGVGLLERGVGCRCLHLFVGVADSVVH